MPILSVFISVFISVAEQGIPLPSLLNLHILFYMWLCCNVPTMPSMDAGTDQAGAIKPVCQ